MLHNSATVAGSTSNSQLVLAVPWVPGAQVHPQHQADQEHQVLLVCQERLLIPSLLGLHHRLVHPEMKIKSSLSEMKIKSLLLTVIS